MPFSSLYSAMQPAMFLTCSGVGVLVDAGVALAVVSVLETERSVFKALLVALSSVEASFLVLLGVEASVLGLFVWFVLELLSCLEDDAAGT